LARFEKIISAFEKYIENQIGEIKQQSQVQSEEQKIMRGDGFQEAMRKQEEMQTTLNLITHNFNKVQEDSQDRAALVREELKAVEGALTQQLQDLQNKVAVDDSTLQQRVQVAFDKTNGKFKEHFEQMMIDH